MKTLIVITAISFGLIGARGQAGQNKLPEQSKNGFAVVELFTSEGCSSCPPADKAVAELAGKHKDHVYILGFHVDYWDQLGWKDLFSNAAYSQRQQHYGAVLGLNSIYTPQVIVNGKTEFVGSDETRLSTTVGEELKENNQAYVKLNVKPGINKMLSVMYSISQDIDGILNFALVQSHAQTDVLKGENKGRKLQHINIVRDFKTVNASNSHGAISLTLPKGLEAGDCKVIAYLQDKNSWRITAAAQAGVQ